MSGPETETLTAALRRLADERATGLLSIATPGRDVVVELAEGRPVAIGPLHDVRDRVGDDAADGLTAVAVVDDLLDRTVAAIVGGEGDWVWDVSSDAERLPVPPGLVDELARRAVDAAQALAVIAPDDVLLPGHEVETSGELDRVRRLYDGDRSMEDVADAAAMTVPAVATMTAALVAAGALALDEDDEEQEEQAISWTDAVRASEEDEDEDDDEPELWVMEPAEDDEPDDEPDDDSEGESRRGLFFGTPQDDEAPTEPEEIVPEEPTDEPSLGDEDADVPRAPAARAAASDAAANDAAVNDAGWNDTAWLDELSPQDEGVDAPPVLAAGDEEPADARAALSSMLQDLQADDPPSPPSNEQPAAQDEGGSDESGSPGTPAPRTERREPKAEPGEVAEFLRELSRLALDDD